jgi:signal transduction histidine kinase
MLSRSDETSTATPPRSTDVAEWWRTTRPLLSKAFHRRCGLKCSIPRTLPRLAMSPHHLTQAILNLFSNAGRAVEDRYAPNFDKGQVHLDAAIEEGDGISMIRIAVSDNGAGMPPEVAAQATDAFFTTRSDERGTGLGLALVHELVSQARGRLEIDSTPDVGTTVVLRVPTDDFHHAASSDGRSKASTTSDDSSAPTIETMTSRDGNTSRPPSEDGRTTKARRVGGGG